MFKMIIGWLEKNKEWVLSGIGLSLIWIVWVSFKFAFRMLFVTRLSNAENELLLECAEKGQLWRLGTSVHGSWVRAGERDFADVNGNDPAIQARYLEAFDSLIGRGLVRHQSGMLYELTGSGFNKARKLAKKQQKPVGLKG